jgi:lactoylglutathione lyase
MAKPNVLEAIPFLWVRSMDDSLRFYSEGLGFEMKLKWEVDGKIRWCELQLGKAFLMLQEYWHEGDHKNLPESPVGVGVTICFICEDAIAVYRQAQTKGLSPSTPVVGNQMWVTELRDPDGYHLLFESATDAPEESVLEEGA